MRRILGWCVDTALDLAGLALMVIQGAVGALIMPAPIIITVLYRCGYIGG